MYESNANVIIFYTLAFLTIFSSLIIIISSKIRHAVAGFIIFLILISLMYFSLNIFIAGFAQIFIGIFAVLLLIICVMKTCSPEKSAIKKSRLFLSIVLSLILLYLIGVLISHFIKSGELLIPEPSGNLSIITSFFVVVKSIFRNYILSYFLVFMMIFVSVIGAGILIPKKKVEDKKINE